MLQTGQHHNATAQAGLPELRSYIDGQRPAASVDRGKLLRNPNTLAPLQEQVADPYVLSVSLDEGRAQPGH